MLSSNMTEYNLESKNLRQIEVKWFFRQLFRYHKRDTVLSNPVHGQ